MYPSAYFTYNPSRLRRAERAFYNKQPGESVCRGGQQSTNGNVLLSV